jgi:RHS repeat-associated protein
VTTLWQKCSFFPCHIVHFPSAITTYDANGSVTGDGTNQFTYDGRGRLVQVTNGPNRMQYQINGLGQRIAKLKNKPSHPDNDDDCADEFHVKGVTDFVYDKDGHLIGEYTRNGKPIRETVYLGDTPVVVLVGKAQYFIYADHLNTPRVITDTRNRVVWRWDTGDPFGATPPDENPSRRGTFTFNLRFPGQYFDQETGLHYNYFRDYDPSTGRYVQSDPIGLNGGTNLYEYAFNNPVTFRDPSGLDALIYNVPIEGLLGLLGLQHSYVVVGQPGDFTYTRVEFGPQGGQSLYRKIGEVSFSIVLPNEVTDLLVYEVKLSSLQDIQLLIEAQKIQNATSSGNFPYSALPGLYGGNSCGTFANHLVNGAGQSPNQSRGF